MYIDETHDSIRTPDLETKIWRYIDLAKLVSLVDSKSLYFSRLDKLGDPLEGTGTRRNYELYANHPDKSLLNSMQNIIDLNRRSFYVSCWHINDTESAGMWSAYAAMDKGIAIQSTVGRIQRSL